LKDVLDEYYKYKGIREFKISSENPEEGLDDEITSFLREHNKDGKLLIVYYNGHGDIDPVTKEPIWMWYDSIFNR
jgi:hypothetical protein